MDHPTSAADRAARIEAGRRYARQLAAESITHDDATGWFEPLYAPAEQGTTAVMWADLAPYPGLAAELAGLPRRGRALVVGCGLGDDAEYVATLGFTTVAFDVSPSAIAAAQRRFPGAAVEYVTADLLSPPQSWAGAFDLVVEVFTLQVLTDAARRIAAAQLARLVAPGGRLLLIARCHGCSPEPRSSPSMRTGWPRNPSWMFSTTTAVRESVAGGHG